jgi:hypothetical protein
MSKPEPDDGQSKTVDRATSQRFQETDRMSYFIVKTAP